MAGPASLTDISIRVVRVGGEGGMKRGVMGRKGGKSLDRFLGITVEYGVEKPSRLCSGQSPRLLLNFQIWNVMKT